MVKDLDVCSAGCFLFPEGSMEPSSCPVCQKPRCSNEYGTPASTMSVLSVGAALAERVLNDEVKPFFSYRATYDNEIHQENIYRDIFSGKVYREEYKQNQQLFQNEGDIGLMVVVDGFQPKHKAEVTMTTICCYIMSMDPAER